MELREWRHSRGLTQGELGAALGFRRESQWSQAERIENGKIKVDADLVVAIDRLTEGAVTADDMQKTRLAYLKNAGKARDFDPGANAGAA